MKPVSLQKVVDEMEMLSGDMTAYINRKTGELFTVDEELASIIEQGEENSEFIPDWQKEILPKVREVLASDDFIALPDEFDIHEYSIMEDFCYSLEDAKLRDKLLSTIRGGGAFRRFKDTIYDKDIQDDWYRYRDEVLRKIAADFLESAGIPFCE